MAINEQASRDATSKAPVLVYSSKPGRMARLVAHRATAAAAARSRCAHAATVIAERGESRHRAVAAAVAVAAAAAALAAKAGCAVRCGTTVYIGLAMRIKGLPVCGPRQPRSIKVSMGWRWGRASRPLGAAEALGERRSARFFG